MSHYIHTNMYQVCMNVEYVFLRVFRASVSIFSIPASVGITRTLCELNFIFKYVHIGIGLSSVEPVLKFTTLFYIL